MLIKPPADWNPPRKSYVIASTPRCGSNLLCQLLAETGSLGVPDEYFNEVVTRHMHPGTKVDIATQCQFARIDGASSNGVMGIKIHAAEMQRIAGYIDIPTWFPRNKWISLRRNDLLGQAISWEIAEQTGAWHSLYTPAREPTYSRSAITKRLEWLETGRRYWMTYFEERSINPLTLSYEELCEDQSRVINEVACFVGERIGQRPEAKGTVDRFQLQRTSLNEEWRRTYLNEMERHLEL